MFLCYVNYYTFFTLFKYLCLCLLDSGASEEYYRTPLCSVLSYLIVLLCLYASSRAIFYYNAIFYNYYETNCQVDTVLGYGSHC